ncbi:MAG: AsmA-like C-terminal region-containing protein [Bacteroidota bacterium]
MKKKTLKILAGVVLVVVVLLIAVPFFLKGKIADIIKNKVNNNITATFDFEEAHLSLFKDFPNAHVALDDISLINAAPFEGDTLFAASHIGLSMSLSELFKTEEDPIAIKRLVLENAKVGIQVDADENANYDISTASEETASGGSEETSNNFQLNLESYSISNASISYDDFSSGMHLELNEMNHSGTGNLSLEQSELVTKTDALVSFELDSTRYLNQNPVALDATIGVDLENNKYTFLENKALVNQLLLVFDGFVKINEDNQEVDIHFKTPSSDFKNFLAVIPENYSQNIENVTTTGDFQVEGNFTGVVDETHIPKFDISMASNNASFKYPDLPQTVEDITIDASIQNKTGITEDTFVDLRRLSFRILQDRFNLSSKITELLGNTRVKAAADGKINLGNLAKAYPFPADHNLKGMLTADLNTAFDMASLENKQYQNTKTSGEMSLSGFQYTSEELKNPLEIQEAAVSFTPDRVALQSFDGKTGRTDFKASGTLDNLLGFMFNDENIEGRFSLNSDTIALDDFMVEETTESETETESEIPSSEKIKIPSFLDCTLDAKANTVLYDNLSLKDVEGTLIIKDETATLQNLRSSLFGGNVGLNGSVSTKEEVSTFDVSLGMDNLGIGESFQALDLFKVLAPLASAFEGKLNSDIKIAGNLKDDFTPNLATVSGNLLAELLNTKVDTEKAPLLNALEGQMSFLDTEKLNLKGLKTALSFDNGKVAVKPFTVNYEDIAVNVSGSHDFEKQLAYTATLDVPAKYLGKEVTDLMEKLDVSESDEVSIPVTANIGGSYSNPNVKTDLTSGVKKLTGQLVEVQKQKLLNQGKDTAQDLLSGILGSEKDSTGTEKSTTQAVLGSLLGKEEKTDSTQKKEDPVESKAKSLLGGLLGKKKKKDSTQTP